MKPFNPTDVAFLISNTNIQERDRAMQIKATRAVLIAGALRGIGFLTPSQYKQIESKAVRRVACAYLRSHAPSQQVMKMAYKRTLNDVRLRETTTFGN